MSVTIQDVHKNAALSNISVAYRPAGMIAVDIAPTVMVVKESDFYYEFGKDNLRIEETVKAEKGEANKFSYTISTANYQIIKHAGEDLVTPRLISQADGGLAPMMDATEMVTDRLVLAFEKAVADVVSATSTYASGMKSTTGTPIWNGSSGDCISQVVSGAAQVALQTGKRGNTVVMDPRTFLGLKSNTVIQERIKYTGRDSVTTDMLAELFEVDRVLVGWTAYNSANQGQDASMSYLWGEGCAVLYIEPSPGLRKPTFAYTFRTQNRVVETRSADNIETGAVWVRVLDDWVFKVIDSSAGYFLIDTVQ